ncbi:MAG: SPOR domain-containing protein [Aquabacterium sp.]|nr:MAG: SPOR domain-containing protein [Aquabacterium sp.]
MPLPSFFQRLRDASADTRSRNSDPAALALARARARRRLIGATILVIAAVAGFPLLFDSQPRPLPSDLGVQLVKSNGEVQTAQVESKPVVAPSTKAGKRSEDAAPPGDEAKPAKVEKPGKPERTEKPEKPDTAGDKPAAAPKPDAAAQVVANPVRPEKKPAASAPPAVVTAAVAKDKQDKPVKEAERARALLEDREPAAGTASNKPAASAAAADGARFVVQVGAYADVDAAREARSKVERLGLKTYTQVIEGPSGKRIRVRIGPFAQRDGADQAAAKVKQAGLTAAVLTL